MFPTPPVPNRGGSSKTPDKDKKSFFSPGRESVPKLNRFSSSNELSSHVLQKTPGVFNRQKSVPDSIDVPAEGGRFNFRQLLRKTNYAATDTLRKMKDERF